MSLQKVPNSNIFYHETIDGNNNKKYEFIVRSPWVRVIITNELKQILIMKEFRKQLNSWDYRIPWWVMYDDIDEYISVRWLPEKLQQRATEQAYKESQEETWVLVKDIILEDISHCGGKIERSLYCLSAKLDNLWNANPEEDEEDITRERMTYDQILDLMTYPNKKIQEPEIQMFLRNYIQKYK